MDADLSFGELIGIEAPPPFDPHNVPPGRIDRGVLLQDQVWVDARGAVHPLAQMSDRYRANVLAHLHLTVHAHHLPMAMDELLDTTLAGHAIQRELNVPLAGELEAHVWLEATPLVRALRALTPDASSAAELTAWAEQQRATLKADPDHRVLMPQDVGRCWNDDVKRR